MMLKILLVYCYLTVELDAKYKQYHKPAWQGSKVPWHGTYNPLHVEPLKYENYSKSIDTQHLLNMSAELIRDANIKNRYASVLQEGYRKSSTYTLGLITAGIIDKFTHMIQIFRYYSRPEITEVTSEDEAKHQHATISMHQAYQIMQGDYNEMRLETKLFFDSIAAVKKKMKQDAMSLDTDKAALSVADFKPTMTVDEWEGLSEQEQNQQMLDMMKEHGYGSDLRRSMRRRRIKLDFTPDAAQEEYKKSLRYQKWAQKWQGFDPKTEGIDISDPLASMGRNKSKFLDVNVF